MDNAVGRELFLVLAEQHGLDVFIETGTADGGTAYWASNHFSHVVTVEYIYSTFLLAFQKYWNVPNLKFVQGDSEFWVPHIAYMVTQPALWFLDAHWVGDGEVAPSGVTPIVGELDVIMRQESDHVIVVDDARLFGTEAGYPTVDKVKALCINHGFMFSQEGDMFVLRRNS